MREEATASAADFVLYTDNIVGMEPSPSMALALVTVMAVLAAVLLLQDRFGARFFLGDQVSPAPLTPASLCGRA